MVKNFIFYYKNAFQPKISPIIKLCVLYLHRNDNEKADIEICPMLHLVMLCEDGVDQIFTAANL